MSVICSNDRLLQLTGPVTLHLEPTACASGTPLPAGSYGRVALKADILAHSGSSLLELDTRDSEGYGLVPIILSPRNTVLGNPRPTIRWVAVTKVVDYQITLKSPENQLTIVIAADNIACKHEQRYQTNICSLPFPDHWPALTVEGSYFLSIGSRESIVGVWRISEELNTLTVFPSEKMAHMSAAVLDLSKTGDLVTVDLLTGDLYVREGFYESAIGVYERVRDSQPSPMVNVVLGNLYQTIKLYRFAFDRYTECLKQLESADSLPVRAAAEFGIGRISFANHQYTDALSHFQKAEKLYAVAGMAAEQAAATQAVAQAQERLTR